MEIHIDISDMSRIVCEVLQLDWYMDTFQKIELTLYNSILYCVCKMQLMSDGLLQSNPLCHRGASITISLLNAL